MESGARSPQRAEIMGLTLPRPLPWAVAYAGLRALTLPFGPSCAPGSFLALHAGRDYDWAEHRRIERETSIPLPSIGQQPQGIVAVARLDRAVSYGPGTPWDWFLRDVVPIQPAVFTKGHAGLWPLPPDVLAEVRERYRQGLGRQASQTRVQAGCMTLRASHPWGEQ